MNDTVVPRAVAILVSEVSVSLLGIRRVEEGFDKTISGSFNIHHFQFLGLENTNTDFKFLSWFFRNIEFLECCRITSCGNNFNPEFDGTLIFLRTWMVKTPVLNRFHWHRIPIRGEVSIFKIDHSLSDQVISEQHVMVPEANLQLWTAREYTLEIDLLVELWIGLINNVILPVVEYLISEIEK